MGAYKKKNTLKKKKKTTNAVVTPKPAIKEHQNKKDYFLVILPSLIIGDLCLLFIYSYLQPDLYFSPVVGCSFVVAMNLIFLIWQHQQNDRRFSLIEHRFNHWSQAQVQHNEEYVEKKRREKKLIQDQRISFQ